MTTARRSTQPPERRGDLTGLAFVLFGAGMLVAIGAVAFLFLSLPEPDAAGGRSPSPSLVAGASESPSASDASPGASTEASPVPSSPGAPPSATATAPAPPVVAVGVGEPAPITANRQQVGTVTVTSARRLDDLPEGPDAPGRRQWLVVEVRYDATTGELPFAPEGWTAEDARGRVYQPMEVPIGGALTSGTLVPGEDTTGFVVFQVRRQPIGRLLLNDASGRPLAAFDLT